MSATDREHSDGNLESHLRFERLFVAMREGVAYCRMLYDAAGRPDDFVYLLVNPAFERLTGLHGAEGRRVTELIPAIKEETPELLETYGRVARDGETAAFDIDFTPLGITMRVRAYQPEPDHFVAVFEDITENKDAEAAIRDLNADLERRVAVRTAQLEVANEEMHNFVSSISHDLRTPLRAIGSYSEILLQEHGAALDEDATDCLRRIARANKRMERLLNGFLELSGVTRGQLAPERVDVTMMAREVSAELLYDTQDRRVVVDVADGLEAYADPDLLRMVFYSMLGNALKFTAGCETTHVEVAGAPGDGESVISVSDNGVGFDMRFQDRLFTPFERLHTDAEFAGTGVGLATAGRIIARHGGQVWAESEVGEGATFFFALPEPGTHS